MFRTFAFILLPANKALVRSRARIGIYKRHYGTRFNWLILKSAFITLKNLNCQADFWIGPWCTPPTFANKKG